MFCWYNKIMAKPCPSFIYKLPIKNCIKLSLVYPLFMSCSIQWKYIWLLVSQAIIAKTCLVNDSFKKHLLMLNTLPQPFKNPMFKGPRHIWKLLNTIFISVIFHPNLKCGILIFNCNASKL